MSDDETPSIEPRELYERIARGEPLHVLDVRNLDEVEQWSIDGPSVDLVQASSVQFLQAQVQDSVEEVADDLGLDEPIVAVCAEGEASANVASALNEAGIEAANLAGGMEAWARLVVSRELSTTDATVVQYLRPASGCLSYLVASNGEAAVVDPLLAHVDRYLDDASERGLSIDDAIDTHVHADHFSGLRELAGRTDADRILPRGSADRGLAFDADLLEDGAILDVGETALEAIHAPGHTTEMTALRVGDVLLSGDSLFLSSVARPDLERGSEGARDLARDLYDTLHERFSALPGGTVVAPGHVSPSDLAADGAYVASLDGLRERVDLLGLDREAFVDRLSTDMPPRPANYETIIEANLGRTTIDGDEAFELELGPNNCAVS